MNDEVTNNTTIQTAINITLTSTTSQLNVQVDLGGYKYGTNVFISKIAECNGCIINSLQDAVKLCNRLEYSCGGITQDFETGKFSLRKGNQLISSNTENSWLKPSGSLKL